MSSDTPDPGLPLPGEPPAEPVEHTMQRLEAHADLAMKRCPICGLPPRVIALRGDLPAAVEPRHRPTCPRRKDEK